MRFLARRARGPKHVAKRGKTPVLTTDQARLLLDSIDTSTLVGLRDRALIGVMTYAFARIGAVVAMRGRGLFRQRQALVGSASTKKAASAPKCPPTTSSKPTSLNIFSVASWLCDMRLDGDVHDALRVERGRLLHLDLPADFYEILRRNVEQVYGPHRIAEHQHEQAQTGAHQPAAPFGADHAVPGAEIDCVFEVDRTSAIFRLPQGGRNVRYLDETEVHNDVPKSLGEIRELDAVAKRNARDIFKFHRQRDCGPPSRLAGASRWTPEPRGDVEPDRVRSGREKIGYRRAWPEAETKAIRPVPVSLKIPFVHGDRPQGDVVLAEKKGESVGARDEQMGGARVAAVGVARQQLRLHCLGK